jgi:rhodanese-related sulfurtransferase
MKKILLVLLLVFSVTTLSACSKGYTDISNEELTTFLDSDEEMQFIDVRTSEEFYTERIPGFTVNIDYYLLENDYSLLEGLNKDIPIVIMCNSGNRSVSAAEIFLSEGFVEVYNLENGIEGWNGETE